MSTPKSLTLPDAARSVTFTAGDHTVGAIVIEPSGDVLGTALLVPGFTGSAEDFIHIFDPLARSGWRVVAIDLPGQKSSPGPKEESAYTLDELGRVVADLVEQLDRPHLLGHSLGGLVVQRAVARGARPASVTLLCSGGEALPEHRHGALPALASVLPEMPLDEVWVIKEELDRAKGWDPATPEAYEFVKARFIAHNPQALRTMALMLLHTPEMSELPGDLPVLVAYGVDDDAWTTEHQDGLATRHGGMSVRIPGAGHSPAVDAPAHTAAVLTSFWSGGLTQSSQGYDPLVDAHFPLVAQPSAPQEARQHLATITDSLDAALIVTELVANAISHGIGPFALHIDSDPPHITLRVSDSDPHTIPVELDAGLDQAHGRGMSLVASLAQQWGWERGPQGKVVWARVVVES